MKDVKHPLLWIGLFVVIVLGMAWQFYPLSDAQKRLDDLPLAGPGFVGMEVPLNDFEKKFFHGVNVIKRVYKINNYYYFVTVLDGTRNRHLVHDPYYCFTGSGWEIAKAEDLTIEGGEAKQIEITKGAQRKSAVFWFADGTENYSSPWKYWAQSTFRRLTLGRSGEEPVLVMIQPLDNTTDVNWNKTLQSLFPLTRML